jgi:hypothetical protein
MLRIPNPLRRGAPRALALPLLALAACSNGPDEGRLVLQVTDAPFPFDLVESTEVTVDSVAVKMSGGGGFFTIDRTPRVLDLLELRGGVTANLADASVPAGSIEQIRIFTSEATIHLTDARSFDLVFPSGSSSGVKVFPSPPIEVAADQTVEALIDFDLGQSFSAVPSSPQRAADITAFHFHPVLRIQNLLHVGAVSGTAWSDAGTPSDTSDDGPLVDAAVTASQAGTDITSTATGDDGRYLLMGLAPGSYDLTVTASGFVPAGGPVTVVAAHETSGADFRLSPTP